MTRPHPAPRVPGHDVDPQFPDRWSPRAFHKAPVTLEQMHSLFEAARWSPSSSNEQPWVFIYARQEEDRGRFFDLLSDGNRNWAGRAPLLVFLAARRHYTRHGKPNRHAAFDAGAAWLALALQARKLGLHAHAMAGFDQERAYDALGVDPERLELMVCIAVGHRADAAGVLPEDLQARERPNGRRPVAEFAFEGRVPAAEAEPGPG